MDIHCLINYLKIKNMIKIIYIEYIEDRCLEKIHAIIKKIYILLIIINYICYIYMYILVMSR